MPGPSTDSKTQQTRGAATPEELATFGQAFNQMNLAGQSQRGLQDPRLQLATMGAERTRINDEIGRLNDALRLAAYEINFKGFGEKSAAVQASAPRQISELKARLASLDASKPLLEKQAQELESQQAFNKRVQSRLDDFVSGRDFGVSPREQELITQGISGISQDVATTRGLNRSDVPVMQAVAPAVSNALLQQANANRSLFTGINQFQQGMDLSGRQLQAGLAGQNPAANLTGVYSGLRSSDFSTKSKQGYGTLDYINAGANLAKGAGAAMTGYADL